MVKRPVIWSAVICLAFVAGCAGTGEIRRSISTHHLVFNPEWTGIPAEAFGRTAWPATNAYAQTAEEVRYRETIIDWQGRFGGERDPIYYRRFHSTRSGQRRQ